MHSIFNTFLAWFICLSLAVLSLALAYAISGLAQLVVTQYFSSLGTLNCPPSPSFFWGHLQLLHDAENTNIYAKWREELGPVFIYRGFIGGYRLVTMDPRAISHILSKPDDYPKPFFVRDNLARMGGEYGLIVVEGDDHKRMRKIINPSFTSPQVRELVPIFYEKAVQLRDIWLNLIDTASSSPAGTHNPSSTLRHTDRLFSPETPILPHRSQSRSNKENEAITTSSRSSLSQTSIPSSQSEKFTSPTKIDVLPWLGRATLDVIGLAGFGYTFNALVNNRDELAAAFADVFNAARQFRILTVLQAWFPILGYFHPSRRSIERSLRTTQRIGRELIYGAQSRLIKNGGFRDIDSRGEGLCEETKLPSHEYGTLKGRDLLSVLIKSNLASTDNDRMSEDEILSQISTFLAAGHETTSSALTWTLYALSRHPRCQSILRQELLSVPTMPSPETISALPYLDMVVRESLRLFSPVSQTMRVAEKDDIVPVSTPYRDKNGQERTEIVIKKGDIIAIPIQAMNKCKRLFGENAEMFIPERWLDDPPDQNLMPTLYSNILTFLHGGRGCVGYKFALLEIKVFLFVLLRDIIFEPCPGLVIEKRLNIVTRPLVQSEPERGNQMPLLLSRAQSTTTRGSPCIHSSFS